MLEKKKHILSLLQESGSESGSDGSAAYRQHKKSRLTRSLLVQQTKDSGSESGSEVAKPRKRGRGRPRKRPLPNHGKYAEARTGVV